MSPVPLRHCSGSPHSLALIERIPLGEFQPVHVAPTGHAVRVQVPMLPTGAVLLPCGDLAVRRTPHYEFDVPAAPGDLTVGVSRALKGGAGPSASPPSLVPGSRCPCSAHGCLGSTLSASSSIRCMHADAAPFTRGSLVNRWPPCTLCLTCRCGARPMWWPCARCRVREWPGWGLWRGRSFRRGRGTVPSSSTLSMSQALLMCH